MRNAAMADGVPWLHSLCHVGQVVPDLEVAMANLTATYGLQWSSVQDRDLVVRDGDGNERPAHLRYTWSTAGPVHIELFQDAPGTIWTTDGNALHHLCYWVEDLAAEAARLRAAGYRLDATRSGPDELNGFAYLVSPDGLRVEPKPERSRPALETWLAGGEFDWPPKAARPAEA
jgi:catechol 2,3-dioxygenase-like lactoylglutathione lyase family enzyme